MPQPRSRTRAHCLKAPELCLQGADAACGLDDAAGDLQQTQTDGGELGVPQRIPTRDRLAQIEQQPIGAGLISIYLGSRQSKH